MNVIDISRVDGFRIGHAQNEDGGTGCSVIISDEGAVAGVSVRGGGPASRETDLLDPTKMCRQIHAVLLAGGSAYGLDAASGVMKYLEENNIGFEIMSGVVPIVPASCLFDLICGDYNCRPDSNMGYDACLDSENDEAVKTGNIGAGTGATVGKFGELDRCMKSGLGTYAVQIGELQIGAIVAVNALGDVYDVDTGEMIAGYLNEDKTDFASTRKLMWNSLSEPKNVFKGNTTLGCLITNASLTKDQCCKLAEMAHDGYANVIKPVHTSADGDTIYFMASGKLKELEINPDALGDLGSYIMSKAINDAIRNAESAYGFIAAKDLDAVTA